MAFTINQQPQEFTPAYNDQIYVVSSTNYSQTNFRYIAKMFIGSDIIIEKSLPHPTLNSCYFNAGRKVEALVTQDINKGLYGYQLNSNSLKSYYVEFYEEYDIAGVLTTSALRATSNVIKIWNGEIDFLNYQSYNDGDYLLDGATGRILNHSLNREVRLTDSGWFHYLVDVVSINTNKVAIRAYASKGGSLLATTVLSNPYQTTATLSHHSIRFDNSPAGLNQIAVGQIFSGAQPIIPSTCTYYEIDFDIANPLLFTFDVVTDCKYETFRLHYLNNLGAFESFNFTKASKHTEEIKKQTYKGIVGGLTSASAYGYSKSDRSVKTFQTTIKDKYKIRTNWLSEDYKEVLKELVSSPVVYWDSADHGLIAIDISNNSFDYDKKLNKKNFNLEIDFELSFDKYRQRC